MTAEKYRSKGIALPEKIEAVGLISKSGLRAFGEVHGKSLLGDGYVRLSTPQTGPNQIVRFTLATGKTELMDLDEWEIVADYLTALQERDQQIKEKRARKQAKKQAKQAGKAPKAQEKLTR
jgi:hypothetical protein